VKLGILVGLRSEARTLARAYDTGVAAIEISGARPELAQAGAKRLINLGCTHLLSYGLAGALAPNLRPGQLILPEAIITPSGIRADVMPSWHQAALGLLGELMPITNALAASDTAIALVADKAALAQRSGAVAVDMESHHLAVAAKDAGLPFLVIRVIADTATQVLPPAALVGVTPSGDTDLKAVLVSVLSHPTQIPALIGLGRAAAAAHRTLTRCDLLGGSLGFGAGNLGTLGLGAKTL